MRWPRAPDDPANLVETSRTVDAALAVLAHRPHDAQAWRDLYRALYPRTLAQAYRLLSGDRAAAQDACHDAFVRLLNLGGLDRFESSDHLGRYFSVMVRNVCLDHLRAAGRRALDTLGDDAASQEVQAGDDDASWSADATDANPEDTLLRKEAYDALVTALQKPDRLLLKLLTDGYTTQEIAARLALTYENAAVRIHRLRKRLQTSRSTPPG
jgi:RNA polymerase sigma factor (sigma-70 family)